MLRTLLLALLIAFTLTACGNKGPLYLPDPTPAPPASPAKDKDKDKPANATQPTAAADSDAPNKH